MSSPPIDRFVAKRDYVRRSGNEIVEGKVNESTATIITGLHHAVVALEQALPFDLLFSGGGGGGGRDSWGVWQHAVAQLPAGSRGQGSCSAS